MTNLIKARRDIETIMLGKLPSNEIEQILAGYLVQLIDLIDDLQGRIIKLEGSLKE